MTTKSIGDYGEKLARRYLWMHGYFVVARNYSSKKGEVDIIAKRGKYIIFVEVKTRTDKNLEYFGRPAKAVNSEKLRHIWSTANHYLRNHKTKKLPRIDIIEVYLSPLDRRKYRIEHIKGITL